MTPEQRQQTVDFLRQLAAWLEDGEQLELKNIDGDWLPVDVDSFFNRFASWAGIVRTKPMERWLVKWKCGESTYDNQDEAAKCETLPEYVRTVHLREVQ